MKAAWYYYLDRILRKASHNERHPHGRYCGNQMCCWGAAGKKPPHLKNLRGPK